MVVQLLSTSGGFTRRCSITSQGLACHDIYSEVITEFNSPIRRKNVCFIKEMYLKGFNN